MQDRLTPARAAALAKKHGRAQIVIARHILEHAHDLPAFAAALKELLVPGGLLVAEVPDFTIPLDQFDYSTIWEEHTVFLTPFTLAESVRRLGFGVNRVLNYPYALENARVAVAQSPEKPEPSPADTAAIAAEVRKGAAFAAAFPRVRAMTRNYLAQYRDKTGRIAMFGAGHLSCKFMNLFGLRGIVDCVVDDHPSKKGLHLPGSHLPVIGSAALVERDIRLCLLTLRPESEEAVVQKNQAFTQRGGEFATIFPVGPRALRLRFQERL